MGGGSAHFLAEVGGKVELMARGALRRTFELPINYSADQVQFFEGRGIFYLPFFLVDSAFLN